MLPLQETSLDIWDKKYRLKNQNGDPVDIDISDTFRRVAKALASVEKKNRKDWQEKFFWALENGAIPAGRILSNAGAQDYKPATSLINCTVSGTIPDSMRGILESNTNAGLTLKSGAGIGYDFSTLRPHGAFVRGAGSTTSGPLSFMDIFDKTCFTVSSAGGRRGAQMGCMSIDHPDIEGFIRAKREQGRLRQFNLSMLATQDFIDAVENNLDWDLAFPALPEELDDSSSRIIYRYWPVTDGYLLDSQGRVAMKVYKTMPAQKLWNLVMSSTYDFAEPGFIMIDTVNEMNNNWFCENIRATNPCGEQPLPPNGACLLGSVNLTSFVDHPFTDNAAFNWEKFIEVVRIFTRMLDNVVEINGLPMESQRQEIMLKRRHGMGYFGLGSALTMLKIAYGSTSSLEFTDKVSLKLARTGWEEGVKLAREKGMAPILKQKFRITEAMMSLRPEMAKEGIKAGDMVPGHILHARYSRYMQRLAGEAPELVESMINHGCRFTHHSSIAPTGTISLSVGNNASNGIEPSFSHSYSRNVIRPGKKSKEKVEVLSHEFLAYRELIDPGATPESLPDYFVTSEVDPKAHVDVQAAAQKWIDSSISKTINVPTDYPFEKFKDIYMYAARKGLKGCTTFRFNPENFQGVLVKEDDLKNTVYVFTLEDGSTVQLAGDEEVFYDGETHTAANLYDALKEGYYGKF
ncbi:MAG: adenosylcobalamin-dependent ribonucleoside-diphosphate reductase [Pseudomonadota bacterium]|nr:adenosylcobalamin-dependent ribonucleoside-diphosphate reductase [Pseudomonadota bacterium]